MVWVGGELAPVHPVDDRGDQSGPISQRAEKVGEQGRRSGLAVRAGNPHQLQLLGGMPVPGGGHAGHGPVRIPYRNVADLLVDEFGQTLAYHRAGSGRYGAGYIVMTVGGGSRNGEEAVVPADPARIVIQPGDVALRGADDRRRLHVSQ